MEHTNLHEESYRDGSFLRAMQGAIDDQRTPTPTSRLSSARSSSRLRTNFSYPRPDGYHLRHEPANSRSSITSNGSMPGMTDASDSEVSVDDDYHYNTMAVWDSFWPPGSDRKHASQMAPPPAIHHPVSPGYVTVKYPNSQLGEGDDDTVTLSQPDPEPRGAKGPVKPLAQPVPPRRLSHRKSIYSIYPKPLSVPPPPPVPEDFLANRMSGLDMNEPRSLQRSGGLKSSKSMASLKARKSMANIAAPPLPPMRPAHPIHTNSVPVPSVPSLVAPSLRPSASAYNVREQSRRLQTAHNATAPLAPLAGPPPDHATPQRPQLSGFVSVFETDSDNESDAEGRGFAKRFARGLKKTGHTRGVSEQRISSIRMERESSLNRRRGGSLGRILGLKAR